MTLTLQIENFSVLDDGGPVNVTVAESGLQAGRNAGMGWVLPDASRHISGHHFDIYFQHGTCGCTTGPPTAPFCRAIVTGWTGGTGCSMATAFRSANISSWP